MVKRAQFVSKVCQHCGNEFKIYPSQERKGLGKYCSKPCKDLARRIEKPLKPVRQPPVFIECATCKKHFKVTPSRRNTAKFCSIKCKFDNAEFMRVMSEVQQGPNSSRWKGGTYLKGTGYVRLKYKTYGKEVARLVHRVEMANWILESNMNHPFLVVDKHGSITLHDDIEVHHIDKVRANNSRDNLLAVTKEAHARIHNHGTKPKPWECWPQDPKKW